MLIPGETLLVCEVTPALFAAVAANEAERAAPGVTLVDVAMIGAAGFFIYAYVGPSTFGAPVVTAAVLSVIVVGVGVGFLPWNFHPARIFMGDSGSMLLGLLLASATISGVGHATLAPSGGDLAAFFIPILPLMILAVPMVDVGMAIVRRLRRGRPIFAPDKEHLHHQLRDLGHTHRQAVVLMYFWSALLAGTALAVTFINGRLVVGAIGGTALFLIAATFVPARVRERRRKRAEALTAVGAEASRPGSFGPDTGLLP
jgi:UDP-GlcNAc:undecaprenyl-phosphate GlcNAc-1-phosphate transferase